MSTLTRPGSSLRKAMLRELRRLSEDLAPLQAHQARKRIKRLRSAIALVRQTLPREAVRGLDAMLARSADELAGLRRAEAMVEIIAKLKAGARDAAERQLCAALGGVALAQVDGMRAGLTETRSAGEALRLITAAEAQIALWRLPNIRQPYADALVRSYRRARTLLQSGLETGVAADLHEARKFVIRHLHQLLLVKAVWPRMVKLQADELTALRVLLGDLNDLDELDQLCATPGTAYASFGDNPVRTALFARWREGLLGRIGSAAGVLFAERPSAFARRLAAIWKARLQTATPP